MSHLLNLSKAPNQWANYWPPNSKSSLEKKIAADPFHFSRHYYLLMIDYYSKFIIIQNLNDLQSSTVINKSKQNSHNLGPQRS